VGDSAELPVQVPVTLSVTPVGNVVILGVPVFPIDCVTECEFVAVGQRVDVWNGLDDIDFVRILVAV
jgi:hypothetical protein